MLKSKRECTLLPQSGRLASDKLVPILAAAGYHQSKFTPGLFKHGTRLIAFCLVVNDFGVKYVGKKHANYLLDTPRQSNYSITVDWEGKQFCGIDLKWDYKNKTVDLSMPGYVAKALQPFEHPPPLTPEDSPCAWTKPNYGAKTRYAPDPDTSPPSEASGI